MRKKKNNKSKSIDLTNVNINIVEQQSQSFKNKLKPRTDNQRKYIEIINNRVITFCQGLPGSGKTHIAVGMALEYLFEEKVKKIIITRPVVEAGEKIGYLPGDANSKLFPYLLPIEDEINHFIGPALNASLKLNNKIEIVPLGYMRGRNFHNSFIIADECQNASYEQLKMLLTRIGRDSKMVLTGDNHQSDLMKYMQGGFSHIINSLKDLDNIGISYLEACDIIRNPIIAHIIEKLEQDES